MFAGDWDRHVYAYDAGNGKILWQTRLPTSARASPSVTWRREDSTWRCPRASAAKLVELPSPELAPDMRRPEQRQLDPGLRAAWWRGDGNEIDAIGHS